jgi:two-component system phosphate regulon sensor histidine kinase PhoR
MKKGNDISPHKRHYEPFLFLMFVTILVIGGFQVYWLKNSYDREKRSLQIKANVAFQETVRHLQAVKLKLKEPAGFDSLHKGKMRVIVDGDLQESDMNVKVMPKQEVVTMVNAMRDKLRDSLKNTRVNSAVIISMNKQDGSHYISSDSLPVKFERRVDGNNRIFQFLYGVDSLQDSLKIPEITSAYQKRIEREALPVPFIVTRLNKANETDDVDFADVTVGFAHPITYHLELGNTFPFLVKRIALPILFSIFLVGVTILSFVILYRNLLKQQRLAALKNEFIGNITHELKTPIATVGVAIEALKNFNAIDDPQRTKEYLDISANELQRLSLLVDKVLKLSMFEKKEIDLKYEDLDLKGVVEEVVTSMRLQIEKYHSKVSISHHGNTHLQGDRLHLLSIVFNLLDNALKYGKPESEVDIALNGNEHTVQLTVADNGIGIAPEYKKKVFEKFFRVPAGDTHNAKGYGLGLSYVAHVVERHHGEISVESKPGQGTKFIVSLPKKSEA